MELCTLSLTTSTGAFLRGSAVPHDLDLTLTPFPAMFDFVYFIPTESFMTSGHVCAVQPSAGAQKMNVLQCLGLRGKSLWAGRSSGIK
jgi:hypothetical protein